MRLLVAVASAALILILAAGAALTAPAAPVDFHRDVRPVLSRHCFKCHGPDDKQRQAGLRLDQREGALKPGPSGKPALVPGRPDASQLVQRIFATHAGRIMPPAHVKNPLTEAQKRALKQWVAEGAVYRPHWAFVAPKGTALPPVRLKSWPRNPIDRFVLARLEREGLKPSPPADRYTLIRRVSLDLTGLPPTPAEADAFVNDRAPDAYERLVDRLLASPNYGERWARRWLDLARYADTNGYEKDRQRSIWPYRDWVIDALNRDMPFDQFTVEQIAGDLLPNPTPQQKIATGFHRNTMLNEEGGIDPLEYRFHAMTDRIATTGTAWLGLTVGCAQCHTHKFDPIPHREYYSLMAFLNNADEPEIDVRTPEIDARRAELEKQAAALEADLPNRFPARTEHVWRVPGGSVSSTGGAAAQRLSDGSFLLSGANPEKDTLTVTLDGDGAEVNAVRLEALPDPSLGGKGPGRTPHGNFVLSEAALFASHTGTEPLRLLRPEADFAQDGFPASHAADGNPQTGWAIHGPGEWNVPRTITFHLERPVTVQPGGKWTVRLDQLHGSQHTLGHFRLSLGRQAAASGSPEVDRRAHLNQKFEDWLARESGRAVRWTPLTPVEAKSNLPLLTILPDGSVLSSGDQTKRDVYDVLFRTELRGITALRLEALPDEGLPKRGPGRIYYEGPAGDFFLSEVSLAADGTPVEIARASHSFAGGGAGASGTLDGNPQTGWSINGGQGRSHTAVFNLRRPLENASKLSLRLLFERYFAAGMGRFRVSVTTDAKPAEAGLPPDVEALLLVPSPERTADQSERLLRYYVSVAPELAPARDEVRKLREGMPQYPTTLVFSERPVNNPRPTFMHRRGEYLQPGERVQPAVLSVLHALPNGAPANRLGFARWLVDPRNPLVGRVTMNRQWAAFFGTGLVRTTEDFGYQGELPSHPELLDFLALQFVGQGWSLKKMHRLIVTSATYMQTARVSHGLYGRDPGNRLLARGPRFRLEAELLRDVALKASGVLSAKLGGPSVFPPQPPGVTSEGTYGPLDWKVSTGQDRYRRGLYTFTKRTAPYAMFNTFDAPSGEACVARREVSNTPLQALTLMNDIVFVEAAQALGKDTAARSQPVEERAAELFRRCLTRPPTSEELALLVGYYEAQKERLAKKELDAAAIAGPGEGDAGDRAAWTLVARSLLNLDEAITRN